MRMRMRTEEGQRKFVEGMGRSRTSEEAPAIAQDNSRSTLFLQYHPQDCADIKTGWPPIP